jgi:hypothetical protein
MLIAQGDSMKEIHYYVTGMMAMAIVLVSSGCAGTLGQNRHTAIGAGIGGVSGFVLTKSTTGSNMAGNGAK